MADFNPFPQAAPDFSDPLGLLRACHERILAHCDTLERLLPHLAAKGLDREAREAMARVHRYFSSAARHHHEDEEHDLFPRLRGRSTALDEIIDALLAEHGELTARWHRLEPLLAVPERAHDGLDEFRIAVNELVIGYRAHARMENDGLLPLAADLLHPAELAELGRCMAARRGITC